MKKTQLLPISLLKSFHLYLLFTLLVSVPFSGALAQCTELRNFAGPDGKNPYGDLLSDGTYLYGMASRGGTSDSGTIFKIKPDGSGYFKLLDFTGAANGSYPYGSLISDGVFLYGMTSSGGAYNDGVVFKIHPDGTGYSNLLNFNGSNGSRANGALFSDGTFLYGMTVHGGTNDFGVIFKIMPDGSGYSKLLDFTGTANGSGPGGSLISDGTFLYGMASSGGVANDGVIFKIKPNGTGFLKLLDFTGSANGSLPFSSLISDGTFLYGMSYYGGSLGLGTIFKIKPDGSGFLKLTDFTGTSNGRNPNGSLLYDGTFLYGLTEAGGVNGMGTLFMIKPDGSAYSKLLDFAGTTNGKWPLGSLITDGSFLYGMTDGGGTIPDGTVFKFGIASGVTEELKEKSFTVYPNPSEGVFQIQLAGFDAGKGPLTLEVYTIGGELIHSSCLRTMVTTLDLSTQARGVYFIKLKSGQGSATQRIIISE